MLQIIVTDPQGEQLAVLDDLVSVSYARRLGQIGAATVTLAEEDIDPSHIHVDGRLEFWRDVAGRPVRDTETSFFLRRPQRERTAQGVRVILGGPSAMDLLRRRIVAYPAGSAQAEKSGPASDLMKAVARENLGPDATDPARNLDPDLWAVDGDDGSGPTLSKGFSRRELLEVDRELSEASVTASDPVFYDVVADGRGFRFRTYPSQRGRDRGIGSDEPLIFSAQMETLADESLVEDYSNEATFIYAGGQGEESDRAIATAEDAVRSGRSPFGRIERWVDARAIGNLTSLQGEADAGLAGGRPRIEGSATLLSTPAALYGRDWGFGDRVVLDVFGRHLDVLVEGVQVTIAEDGTEQIQGLVGGVGD